ncbi:glutathione S-transferase [Psychromonas aquimarina]|uniref:glutathione S-transferase n=1 Tax=Psychromonas aquimarina TaxID=444919 RepID=UPI00041AFD91|nr:glutathione S-transferase [Psychromonas aquimarina]
MRHTLYSFRRCPYAMRARLALAVSLQSVNLREIVLQQKPAEMLAVSTQGTVPVLQLTDGTVLDESLDIMVWALEKSDPDGWLTSDLPEMLTLIDENDFEFKQWLDKYKYAERFSEYPVSYYRQQAEDFIFRLENRLLNKPYLFGQKISLADMAIFPFIRQFAGVDKSSFEQSPYPNLKIWLDSLIHSSLFEQAMEKYPLWLESGEQFSFP